MLYGFGKKLQNPKPRIAKLPQPVLHAGGQLLLNELVAKQPRGRFGFSEDCRPFSKIPAQCSTVPGGWVESY